MQYNADRRLFGTCLIVISMLSFGAIATPQEKIPTDEQSYLAYMAGKGFAYFLTHPSGALVKPFLTRISATGDSAEDFQNIQQLLLPAMANANKLTIKKLNTDIEALAKNEKRDEKKEAKLHHALALAQSLDELVAKWRAVKSYDSASLREMAKEAQGFLEKEAESKLSSQWIAANRLAGFTNSLSNHATAFGVDLQAMTKLAPQGIAILHGQKEGMNHHGKMEPLWEANRHLGANNELVKFASWGNIIGTGLKVPLHYGTKAYAAGNYTQAASQVWEHAEEFGIYQLASDGGHEVVETLRGLFWLTTLIQHNEAWLAKDAFVKWFGEMGPATRRLRKFIQLHPEGNLYLYMVQNTIAVPMFFLDFEEGYLGLLSEQWDSLMKKEYGSGEFYAEALNMGLTGVGPFMAGLHMYLHGFGKRVAPALENSPARHFYNGFQYGTYAGIQSVIHLNLFADFVADSTGFKEGYSRYAVKAGAASIAGTVVYGLYEGYMGEQAKMRAQTWVPRLARLFLWDNILSNIVGGATGDSHFNVLRTGLKASRDLAKYAYAKVASAFSGSKDKQEL